MLRVLRLRLPTVLTQDAQVVSNWSTAQEKVVDNTPPPEATETQPLSDLVDPGDSRSATEELALQISLKEQRTSGGEWTRYRYFGGHESVGAVDPEVPEKDIGWGR